VISSGELLIKLRICHPEHAEAYWFSLAASAPSANNKIPRFARDQNWQPPFSSERL
jgi:hypothetical protein